MTLEGDESVPLYTYITLNYIYRGLKLKFDLWGFATCPDCGTTINCGTGGIQNLNKWHRGGKSCRKAKIKRNKCAKKMKNGSLSFLKPKAIPVPSMVRDPGPVMIHASDHIHPTLASMASHHPSSSLSHVGEERGLPVPSLGIQQTGSGFTRRFEEIVKSLPENQQRIYQLPLETTS